GGGRRWGGGLGAGSRRGGGGAVRGALHGMPRREAQGSRHQLRSAQAHRRAAVALRQVRVGGQRPDAAVARDAQRNGTRSALGVYSSARVLSLDKRGPLARESLRP